MTGPRGDHDGGPADPDDPWVAAVLAVRPRVRLREGSSPLPDERVLRGGGEVFRLPLTGSAVTRHRLLVTALPRLRPLLPVAVPLPRPVGVLADGTTPFTAEARLPGASVRDLGGIARSQVEGVLAALLDVPPREAAQWGVPGEGALLHGALGLDALLADPGTGVLTGVVGWDLRLGDPAAAARADLALLL